MKALLAALLLVAAGVSATAADVDVRNLANSCAICHGTDGKPPPHGLERLAGMNKRDFISEMQDMKKNCMEAHLMCYVARGYSDAEIRAMANYFSQIH